MLISKILNVIVATMAKGTIDIDMSDVLATFRALEILSEAEPAETHTRTCYIDAGGKRQWYDLTWTPSTKGPAVVLAPVGESQRIPERDRGGDVPPYETPDSEGAE